MSRVTVLYHPDRTTQLYSLTPLVASKHSREFVFTRSLEHVLERDENRRLILFRFRECVGAAAPLQEVLARLRARYERIVYFDDRAAADSILGPGLEHCDLYFKKQIVRDRSRYTRPLWGGRGFSDFYHREFGVEDPEVPIREGVVSDHLHKLRVAWNLGLGIYPRAKRRLRVARRLARLFGPRAVRLLFRPPPRPGAGPRAPAVRARFGRRFEPASIGYQRELFARTIAADPRFRTGRLPEREYTRELAGVRATLSPFGFGEVCFRDFEAVVAGSTLVKPNMDHLETWPDIYRDGHTCVAVRWDGGDLLEHTTALLEDPSRASLLAENAFDALHDAFRAVDCRVEALLEE